MAEIYTFNMDNSFSQKEVWFSWETKLSMNWNTIWDRDNWELHIKWKVQMWAWASPISWDIEAKWDVENTPSKATWNVSYAVNIPNIATGWYKLDYDFDISDTPDSKFETPADIIPQKNLDTLMQINKAKIEKERAEQKITELEAYRNGSKQPDQAWEKLRDIQRLNDMRWLQTAIEQSYQDEARYPSYWEFVEMTSYYIEKIPSEVYPWYIKNWCDFWYTYAVADDSGIQNWKYRLSTCLESDSNISTKAINSRDNWKDNQSFELGIDVWGNDFNEVVLISDIVSGKYDKTHQFKEQNSIPSAKVQSSYSSLPSYWRNPSQFLEEKSNAIKSDFSIRIQELYEIIESQMKNSLEIPFEVYLIPDGDIQIGSDIRIEVWDMDYTFLEMQLTWNQRQYWDLIVKDDYNQAVRAAVVYKNINGSYKFDSYELWWNKQDIYGDTVWTTIGTYKPSSELSKNSLFDYNFKPY